MEEKVEAQDHDRSDSEDKEGMHMADDPHRDLETGKVASESEASDSASTEDINPELTQVVTGNSVPASVLSHPTSGGALGRAVTGPKNKSLDEEGRIVVNWASGTDPENPKNWPRRKKIFNVVVISSMTFLCPLCSSMFVLPSKPRSEFSDRFKAFADGVVSWVATDYGGLSDESDVGCILGVGFSVGFRIGAADSCAIE
jgi:hypothetical protein